MAEMDIETADDILQQLAENGSMDYSAWPRLLPVVVSRIEKNARTMFRIPSFARQPPRPQAPSPRSSVPLPSSDTIEPPASSDDAPSSSQDKENANPSSSPTAASKAPASASNTSLPLRPREEQPESDVVLPAFLAAQLDEITSTLKDGFPRYPPLTIQRLAELVLQPTRNYRSLVAYLHALDRVVHVTSSANAYPLPPAVPDMSAMSVLANGVGSSSSAAGPSGTNSNSAAAANNVGSDEALGGALLTPIPWLARRANGMAGSSEDGSSDAGSSSPLSVGSGQGGSGNSGNTPQLSHMQLQSQPQSQPQTQSSSSQHSQSQQSQRQVSGLEAQVRTESTETIEGPNGIGSIETVSVSVNGIPSMGAMGAGGRGVTQGELLRQEQRAGVVPVSQLARQQQALQQAQAQGGSSAGAGDEDDIMDDDHNDTPDDAEEEEVPHARGPEEIGPADTGPQPSSSNFHVGPEMQGIDVEAAVGRTQLKSPPPASGASAESAEDAGAMDVVPQSPKREAEDDLESGTSKRVKEDGQTEETGGKEQEKKDEEKKGEEVEGEGEGEKKDAEGDVVLSDPPEPTEEEKGEEQQKAEETQAESAQIEEGKDL
ncbi:hypothetical protein QBC46DRAFT_156202 [Diplogelasinospora grovesii]|uniref:Protein phosphatase 4 core regulatory subunit R2 n=1 Tax=Diplogelasinospora grovesii TaxID=303347 RepID=A0AAN6N4B9_9PEZI|nr:hypothetical protein QBC46DRAFT_156202 [Diplogelasinospora grovesii]